MLRVRSPQMPPSTEYDDSRVSTTLRASGLMDMVTSTLWSSLRTSSLRTRPTTRPE